MTSIPSIEGLAGEVATDAKTRDTYSRDASLFKITPEAVVFPKSSKDIGELVAYATKNRASLTVRSGGSDMSGGALTESIVVDVSRYINKFIAIGNHEATVQPGMFYRDFEPKTLEKSLLLPSYPASRNLCTVGGMVANNSGGEKTLMYGKTEKYVKALKVVLADGNEYALRPLNADEVHAKMKEQTFEGKLYYNLANLISNNEELIKNAKPHVSKNSTGYNIWDVWNGEVFDLTKLFVGSQGTLGIITEITFELITPKPHSRMLVMVLDNIHDLATIVEKVLRYHPESFESYDKQTLKLALKYFPELVRQMKARMASLLLQFIPDIPLAIATHGLPEFVLMAEFTGDNEEEITKRAKAAQAAVKELVTASRVTHSENEAEKYWTIRRESFNLLRKKVRGKQTAPFIDDFIVEPKYLPEFLPKLNALLSEYDIFYTIAGHVGNGNFHIIPLMDLSDPKQIAIISELAPKVYELVFAYKGSMSAEHNDGLIRSHFLKEMYGEKMYHVFEEIKRIFDPNNIFNPHKKVDSSWDYAKQFIKGK